MSGSVKSVWIANYCWLTVLPFYNWRFAVMGVGDVVARGGPHITTRGEQKLPKTVAIVERYKRGFGVG